MPSVWEWPELKAFAEKFNMKTVSFPKENVGTADENQPPDEFARDG